MRFLPLLVVMFFVLVPNNAFASVGGFLDTHPLNRGSYTALYDNNNFTTANINTGQHIFAKDLAGITVTEIYYHSPNTSTSIYYSLRNENNIEIRKVNTSSGRRWVDIPDTPGVHRIVYNQGLGSYTQAVEEFDFKGFYAITPLPITSIQETHNYNSVSLTWTNPISNEFTGIIIEKDGVEIANLPNNQAAYQIGSLAPETTYVFEIYAKYSDGTNSPSETITVTTSVQPADITPPENIKNLSVVKTSEMANFLYELPIDTDFSHLEIYRNNVLIESNYTNSTFNDFGLVPNTSYVYKFVSVDIDDNRSTGYIQTVLTEMEMDSIAPSAPQGLSGTNSTSAGRVSWSRNTEPDLKGYNLFVDGVLYNPSEILATNYTINGLENGTSYSVTVTATDTSGNESEQSVPVILNPSESEMPIFTTNYTLRDISEGTSNWFSTLWPILAFSIGIPLAFYVATRTKHLFFA